MCVCKVCCCEEWRLFVQALDCFIVEFKISSRRETHPTLWQIYEKYALSRRAAVEKWGASTCESFIFSWFIIQLI